MHTAKEFQEIMEQDRLTPGYADHKFWGKPAPGTPEFEALQQQQAADQAAQEAERCALEDELEKFGGGHPGVRRRCKPKEES